MSGKKYNQVKSAATFFIGITVAVAVLRDSFLLAAAGVLTGMAFAVLVRSKAGTRSDEREIAVSEKAAKMAYAVFAPTIGIASFLLLFPSKSGLAVFSRGEWVYTESLGMVFAYLTLFLITIYAISYHYFNRKFGGGNGEE